MELNKRCRKCRQIKPYTEEYFYWKSKKDRILKDCCKECSREYKKILNDRIDKIRYFK